MMTPPVFGMATPVESFSGRAEGFVTISVGRIGSERQKSVPAVMTEPAVLT